MVELIAAPRCADRFSNHDIFWRLAALAVDLITTQTAPTRSGKVMFPVPLREGRPLRHNETGYAPIRLISWSRSAF
jgi:hypothetical protein